MTGLVPEVDELLPELVAFRRDLHAHPETAFEETRSGELVATQLSAAGLDVHRMARTGVVGVLSNGIGPRIALRADLDALHIVEATSLPYESRQPGRMHACGHDGHTTMLLGAARHLARHRDFSGTVVFIFQPAEENEGGGRALVEEGLFDRFPVDGVYGLHNWPGLPVGRFATRPGALMASYDVFEVTIRGQGAHGAMPHLGIDPVVVAAQVVTALQTLVSRAIDPLKAAVVSVTQIHAGDTWNVIPESAVLRGTVRSFEPSVQDTLEAGLSRIVHHVGEALGARCTVSYQRRYPPTVNAATETARAVRAATEVVGAEYVDAMAPPSMGSEDLSFLLNQRPGCHMFIGNGPDDGGRNLHSPFYDFNDAVIPFGVSYWIRLVQSLLPAGR